MDNFDLRKYLAENEDKYLTAISAQSLSKVIQGVLLLLTDGELDSYMNRIKDLISEKEYLDLKNSIETLLTKFQKYQKETYPE
jgi:hypothetical protein